MTSVLSQLRKDILKVTGYGLRQQMESDLADLPKPTVPEPVGQFVQRIKRDLKTLKSLK